MPKIRALGARNPAGGHTPGLCAPGDRAPGHRIPAGGGGAAVELVVVRLVAAALALALLTACAAPGAGGGDGGSLVDDDADSALIHPRDFDPRGTAPSGDTPAAAVPASTHPDDRLIVATTFTVLADMVRQVGGGRVQVESITTPGADVHYYEPTAGDLRRVEGADLVVSNGLGMDDWLLRFLDGTHVRHVVTTDGIDPLPVRAGTATGRPNPHAWMSPTEGAGYVRAIAAALADLDPAGAAGYTARADAYIARLDELAVRARETVATIPPQRRVLVTCEGAFSYLARDLGLDELYLWPVNSENQGLPRQVSGLIDEVRDRRPPAVFCESTVSDDAMAQVADETGSRLAGPLYVDSLSAEDGPVPTYLDLLDHDLRTITRALTS